MLVPASSSAAWIMRTATLGAVRKLKASTAGTYLFETDVEPGSGAAGTLLGRPVYIDPFVDAIGVGADPIFFGDFSKVWVRQAGGLRFESGEHAAFSSDLITFRALARLDSALVDVNAIKRYRTT